jgi:hypothetical protein
MPNAADSFAAFGMTFVASSQPVVVSSPSKPHGLSLLLYGSVQRWINGK